MKKLLLLAIASTFSAGAWASPTCDKLAKIAELNASNYGDEATALIWSEAEKANNVLPLTVVNVPISCALDGVDALYTAQGIRVSVRTLAYVGTADQTATALASVRSRLQKDIANGALFKEDPTATTAEQTIVG